MPENRRLWTKTTRLSVPQPYLVDFFAPTIFEIKERVRAHLLERHVGCLS